MDIKELLEPINRATVSGFIDARAARKLAIEQAIVDYGPDGVDAGEMLQAFAQGLRRHYGQDNCTEALLLLSMAKNALDRLDIGYQIDAADELAAIENLRARMERRMP